MGFGYGKSNRLMSRQRDVSQTNWVCSRVRLGPRAPGVALWGVYGMH